MARNTKGESFPPGRAQLLEAMAWVEDAGRQLAKCNAIDALDSMRLARERLERAENEIRCAREAALTALRKDNTTRAAP